MYLEKINGPEDVKKIKIDELPVLAQEIRDALLVRASKHGGHFGPNFGIAENHGGLYQNLALLRKTDGQAECNLFKAMGLDYVYVDRGNDVAALIKAFKEVKDSTKPVVVHINTLKGKGYAPAEKCKEQWHYSGPFDIETGKPLFDNVEEDYSSVTGEYLLEKMKNDSSVVAITSGTPTVNLIRLQ